jgi:hypothetical protein
LVAGFACEGWCFDVSVLAADDMMGVVLQQAMKKCEVR